MKCLIGGGGVFDVLNIYLFVSAGAIEWFVYFTAVLLLY